MFSSTSTQTGRISIHALREEGDLDPSQSLRGVRISIHALREEGDTSPPSTTPVSSRNFYPRPPRGGRLVGRCLVVRTTEFLSTPSARRATTSEDFHCIREPISIHALREEGDTLYHKSSLTMRDFYPRPPRGGRPIRPRRPSPPHNFYPRPPRGGRPLPPLPCAWLANFYPRPPRGGRRLPVGKAGKIRRISIHALREEGDVMGYITIFTERISIHALREEGDVEDTQLFIKRFNFYPRPPRGGRRRSSRSSRG